MDKLSPERRSALMSRVRATNTSPEMTVRRLLHRAGYRYRLHSRKLPGKPDLVFPARRKAVFVHGCFWHSHNGCANARPPKSREDYWLPKLFRTRERDAQNLVLLNALGWSALVIWQCQLKKPDRVVAMLLQFLGAPTAKS